MIPGIAMRTDRRPVLPNGGARPVADLQHEARVSA
jgi:hypothetical protein